MGSLDRISTVLHSNVNTLLQGAAQPEQALEQLLQEMADGLNVARGEVVETIVREKQMASDRDRNIALAREWDDNAAAAMQRGAKKLAVESLRRKLDYERNAHVYDTQLHAQSVIVKKLKRDALLLGSKYRGITRGREALMAKYRDAADDGGRMKHAPATKGRK